MKKHENEYECDWTPEDLKLILIALQAESRGCDKALQHITDVDEFEHAAGVATRYRQLVAGLEYQLEE